MPQVNLMAAPAQAMQRDKHRLAIQRTYLLELRIFVKRSPRRQFGITAFVGWNNEVYGKCPGEGGVVGVEDMPPVVDGYVVASYGCPEGLQVAVEEKGVESAGRGDSLAEI